MTLVASAVAFALIGCSGSSTLSSESTLAPLERPSSTDATTSTVTVTTLAGVATTLPGPSATMTPPTLNPGSTTPATVAPETTLVTTPPETTSPPAETTATTDPPAPTVAPTACQSCRADYAFAYASFFAVPQLGTEPVRGTGCGANSSIGEVIPDGIWDGHITVGPSSLKIDLQCVYYGASAAPYVARCEQTADADTCLEYGDDFWIVNNSTRMRTVPLDPSFRRRYASSDGCVDPGPGRGASSDSAGADEMDSWVVIEGGKATFVLTSCVYG